MRGLSWCLLFVAGCDAVPDVVYVPDDAALDGNTCGTQVPPYASSCCGPIACGGAGCDAACDDCLTKCAVTDLCCPTATQHQVVCSKTQQCP